MNFLAHLWLADRSGTSLAGSILGDVVRGADLSAYPPDIALGIRLHRRIDATTDRHSLIVSARQQFAPETRRYAGIVLDVICDHLLALDWPQFADELLPDFCQRAGAAIADATPWFQLAGGRGSSGERFTSLLLSYQHEPGIDRALASIAARLRRPEPLLDAARGWQVHAQWLRPQLPQLLAALRAELDLAIAAQAASVAAAAAAADSVASISRETFE